MLRILFPLVCLFAALTHVSRAGTCTKRVAIRESYMEREDCGWWGWSTCYTTGYRNAYKSVTECCANTYGPVAHGCPGNCPFEQATVEDTCGNRICRNFVCDESTLGYNTATSRIKTLNEDDDSEQLLWSINGMCFVQHSCDCNNATIMTGTCTCSRNIPCDTCTLTGGEDVIEMRGMAIYRKTCSAPGCRDCTNKPGCFDTARKRSSYSLTVSCYNSQYPSYRTNSTFKVSVRPNSPVSLESNTYTATVYADTTQGTTLAVLTPQDDDITNDVSLTLSQPRSYFTQNQLFAINNQRLELIGDLSQEHSGTYSLNVCAADRRSTACINVNVTIDIDECSRDPCSNGGQCQNSDTSYFTCTCNSRWTGPTCSIDVNECDTQAPCAHGFCNNVPGGYDCTCNEGWTGDDCIYDIDECTNSPCVHGSCNNQDGSFECICSSGWTGTLCNTDVDECASSSFPCGHGVCNNLPGNFNCTCNQGWTGVDCSHDIDECSSDPCENGDCTNVDGSFTCTCDSGWTGEFCDEDINECTGDPCGHGDCTNMDGSFMCTCSDGWTGTQCGEDIDECVLDPCGNGDCENVDGGFTCSCTDGWTGDLCDNDIDECSNDPCENGDCANEDGTFTCACSDGWTGELCDEDISDGSTGGSGGKPGAGTGSGSNSNNTDGSSGTGSGSNGNGSGSTGGSDGTTGNDTGSNGDNTGQTGGSTGDSTGNGDGSGSNGTGSTGGSDGNAGTGSDGGTNNQNDGSTGGNGTGSNLGTGDMEDNGEIYVTLDEHLQLQELVYELNNTVNLLLQYHNGQPGSGWANSPSYQFNFEINYNCTFSEGYASVPGMQQWCIWNCNHIPAFCPESHCDCHGEWPPEYRNCTNAEDATNLPADYCSRYCNENPPHCPEDDCVCDDGQYT